MPVSVAPAAKPAVDFLHGQKITVVSIDARKFYGDAPPGARLLAAHLVNLEAIGKLSRRMQLEWRGKEPALVQ